ncbi:hypothetical protein AMJ57_01065 [Parcubacteria bacterium SG8_24]|nr:MAG: hypothetical protein AMJ57_01065 [Parcubacteria bacterium SG8_24]
MSRASDRILINRRSLYAAAVPLVATVFLFLMVLPALAHECPRRNPDGSIQCTTGNFWCGNTCRPDGEITAIENGCAVNQVFRCSSCSCVCDTENYPCSGCTAQQVNIGDSCSDPIGGEHYNICGTDCRCPSGYTECAATNTCVADQACPPGTVWDPCTATCGTDYVLSDPASAQVTGIWITGDINTTDGDLYLASGKAIRVDGAGRTALNIGNWGGGTGVDVTIGGDLYGGELYADGSFHGASFCITGGTEDCVTSWDDALPTGTVNQVLRHNGTSWAASNGLTITAAGQVGVGFANPTERLWVNGNARVTSGIGAGSENPIATWGIRAGGNTGGGYFADAGESGWAQLGFGHYGIIAKGYYGNEFEDLDGPGRVYLGYNNTYGVYAQGTSHYFGGHKTTGAGGNVGIGIESPTAKLDVNGDVKMTGFNLTTGAGAGRVLTSDASGVGTWQDPPSAIGGSGTTNRLAKFTSASSVGNSQVTDDGTKVSVGSAFQVDGATGSTGIGTTALTDRILNVDRTSSVLGSQYGAYFNHDQNYVGIDDAYTYGVYAMADNNNTYSAGSGTYSRAFGVYGGAYSTTNNIGWTYGVYGYGGTGDAAHGVYGQAASGTQNYALYGNASSAATSSNAGVWTYVYGAPVNYGGYLYANGYGSTGTNYGAYNYVWGNDSTGTNYGSYNIVQGSGVDASTNYAGYFSATHGVTNWGIYVAASDKNYINANLGIGTSNPAAQLDVAGTAQMTGFKMTTGAGAGKVLTSDASGTGTWQAAPSGPWTVSGSDVYRSTGFVGIGESAPDAPLHIKSNIETFDFEGVGTSVAIEPVSATRDTGISLKATRGGTETWQIRAGYGYSGTSRNLHFLTHSNASSKMTISPDGRVGINGSTAAAINQLSALTVKPPPDVTNFGGTTTANNSTTISLGSGQQFNELGRGSRISLSSAPSTYATVTAVTNPYTVTVDTPLGNGTSQTVNVKHSLFRLEDTSSNVKVVVNDEGKMGINTTVPKAELDVNGDIRVQRIAPAYGSWSGIGDGGAAIVNDNGTYKALMIVGSDQNNAANGCDSVRCVRMWDRVKVEGNLYTSGSVGIGTTTPNSLLQVAGLVNFDTASASTYLGSGAGNSASTNTTYNTFIGQSAGYSDAGASYGDYNTAVGYAALYSNADPYQDTAVGYWAMGSGASGQYNTAVGAYAMRYMIGNYNTAVGRYAMYGYTPYDGYYNSALGYYALRYLSSGVGNTGVGMYAGYSGTYVSTGSYNTFLGYGAGLSGAQYDRATAIGYNAMVSCSDCIVLGDADNVGIGTSAPERRLHVYNGSAGTVTANGNSPLVVENSTHGYIHILTPSTTEQGVLFGDNVDNISGALIVDTSNTMQFRSGGNTTRMWLNADGDLGIGTSPSFARLKVNKAGGGRAFWGQSTAAQGSSNNIGIEVDGQSSNLRNYGVLARGYGGSGALNFGGWFYADQGSTNYGVYASGASPGYDFYATGSGTNYGASSSIRWKRDIREIDSALNKILNLRGVYFTWDEEHGGLHDIGMIAEEVNEFVPEIVVMDTEDPEYATGMDYSMLTPVLVEAVKEQQEEIEELRAEIEELKALLQDR